MNWILLITAILLILFNTGLIILAIYYWPKFDRFIVFPEAEDNLKIGVIDTPEDLIKRLSNAKKQNAEITADYIKRKNGVASVLIKSSVPVFKAEKQEVKPYLKKGAIDEDEDED